MLINLKGIRSDHLENFIDFMYDGEASITQEELARFKEKFNMIRKRPRQS